MKSSRTVLPLILTLIMCSLSGQGQNSYSDPQSDSLKMLITNAKTLEEEVITKLALGKYLIHKDQIGLKYIEEVIDIALDHERQLGKYLPGAYWAYGMYFNNVDSGAQVQISSQRAALKYSKRYESIEKQANTMVGLGNVYTNTNLDSSVFYFEKALVIFDSLGIESAGLYENLGNLSFYLDKDPQVTLNYYSEAKRVSFDTNDTIALGILYYNISLIYLNIPQLDSSLHYLEEAFAFLERNPKTPLRVPKEDYFKRKGNILLDQKKYSEAIENLEMAAKESTKTENFERLALIRQLLGIAYFESNELSKAKQNLDLSISLSKQNGLLDLHMEALKIVHEINVTEGYFESALAHFKTYISLKDSLENMKFGSRTELENKILAGSENLKQLENELLRKEVLIQQVNLRNKNILAIVSLSGAALLTIFGVTFFISSRRYRKQSTELEFANSKVKIQSEKLKELDKLKSQFFANISHDLRTPLSLIIGVINKTLEKDYRVLDKESLGFLDIGMKNAKRLLYLSNEIMDLTKLEEGKMKLQLELIQVVPYTRFLTQMFTSASEIKSIVLTFNSDLPDEIAVHLDPEQFEKIFYNLISNAIKYTPEGGKIDVNIKKSTEGAMVLAVSDTGLGIEEKNVEHIFDRYYQAQNTNSPQAGVGIGLALVKELVQLHGGSIDVVSSSNGSTFSACFPLEANSDGAKVPDYSLDIITRNSLWADLQEEVDKKLPVPALTNQEPNASTVLIVEDHLELRLYLKSIISFDFKILEASNGKEALELLSSRKIDLVLTDLMMPYMDGFELIERLQSDKTLKKIPVLVVSARTNTDEKLQLFEKGAEIIQKPFQKVELMLRIKKMISSESNNEFRLKKIYQESAKDYEKSLLEKIENLIVKNISNPNLSVLDISDEIAASERKVYRVIKKISGMTPHDLIKEIRWQYFENYIENNPVKSLSEAARVLGMTNANYFGKQYKKRFGVDLLEKLQ